MTDFVQNSKEWLLWRAEGVGASDAPIIMGKSKYKTKLELWDEKFKKEIKDEEPNFIQNKGHELEAWARSHYITQTGFNFVPRNFVHANFEFIRASMDGFCEQIWEGLEVKYMGKELYQKLIDETLTITERIPEQYFDQIMQQFFVTNCVAITLIGVCDTLVPNPEKEGKFKRVMFTLRIVFKPEFQDYIQNKLAPEIFSFWESVQNGNRPQLTDDDYLELEPGPDYSKEEIEQVNELKILLGKYAELSAFESKYKKDTDEVWEKIKNHPMRIHSRMTFGKIKMVLAAGSPSVDYKEAFNSFVAWIQSVKMHAPDHELISAIRNFPDVPNLEKFTKAKSESFKITCPKPKAVKTKEKTAAAEGEVKKVRKTKEKEKFSREIEMQEWNLMTPEEQNLQARLNTFMHPETGETPKDWHQISRMEKVKKLLGIAKKLTNTADKQDFHNLALEIEKIDKEVKMRLALDKAKIA